MSKSPNSMEVRWCPFTYGPRDDERRWHRESITRLAVSTFEACDINDAWTVVTPSWYRSRASSCDMSSESRWLIDMPYSVFRDRFEALT